MQCDILCAGAINVHIQMSPYKHQAGTSDQGVWVLNSGSNQWMNSGDLHHCLSSKSLTGRFLDI